MMIEKLDYYCDLAEKKNILEKKEGEIYSEEDRDIVREGITKILNKIDLGVIQRDNKKLDSQFKTEISDIQHIRKIWPKGNPFQQIIQIYINFKPLLN